MNLQDVLKQKQIVATKIKEKHKFLKKYTALWIISISDKAVIKEIRDGLLTLPIWFVVIMEGIEEQKLWKNIVALSTLNTAEYIGFDFIVCDEDTKKLSEFFWVGVCPISIKKWALGNILEDFNALKNRGNAYLFDKLTKWEIFAAIIRYMENKKFPMDNKNLVSNILKI